MQLQKLCLAYQSLKVEEKNLILEWESNLCVKVKSINF